MKRKSATKMVFVAIDKVFEPSQNPKDMEEALSEVECIADIHYSEKFENMALDLFFVPRENCSYPVIFEIHGGGFAAGDKKYRRCLCKYLAKNTGAAVVNVNYGIGSEYACPLPMQHLCDAVKWVSDNAEKYNFDLTKFVVTGDSAGAFYACFLAALQNSEHLQRLFGCSLTTPFTATVLNCGLYDMKKALSRKMLLTNGVCRELTGMDLKEAEASPLFEGLSIISHITEKFPETLLIYSQKDVFCSGQGEALLAKLKEENVPVETVKSTSFSDNHVFSLNWKTKMAKTANERILDFLKRHFQKLK